MNLYNLRYFNFRVKNKRLVLLENPQCFVLYNAADTIYVKFEKA